MYKKNREEMSPGGQSQLNTSVDNYEMIDPAITAVEAKKCYSRNMVKGGSEKLPQKLGV